MILNEQKPFEIEKPEIDEETTTRFPYQVVLYNDDHHTFEEVIIQLMKAVNCSFEKARDFAFEVHVKGKAIVFNGSLEDCLKVSSILEEIALHTQVIS
ncbi:MAG: ATP-dependent Clp protease adaptor ClpS [Melioribacteraceae bacterium]|nr:ATP-dependent Clp protease adaptor ClpS [Melioribacteraceae bacterium]MCF8355528.1 ATP-dependent Clp protease adaptor ClpS [Melioribacteraceae bacterium]MCF8394517.1 ATP-dependent Clp protease adaptor ClpS [Melioribacteraceae bacterium]MCF8420133.1 ATP-dependent Clp protease adaptor ClpS [Melioribacteraceae bacterium]